MLRPLRFTVFVFTALALALSNSQADAKTIEFKSEVSNGKWSRTLRGTLTFPNGKGPFPAVVFLHPCAGITKQVRESQRAHSGYLLKNGFATFTVDSFGPRRLNGGKACKGVLVDTSIRFMADDAFNALDALEKLDKVSKGDIFLAGQSLGASAGLIAALADQAPRKQIFRGIAAYYPSCGWISPVTKLRSPLITFGGEWDDWTPPGRCRSAKKIGNWSSGPEFEVIVYPKALHGFDQRGKTRRYNGHLLGYSASATADSRKKMVEFFKRQMKVKP